MRKVLLVVLVLIIGGLFAADRFAVDRAESEISRQVATQYGLQERPSVKIGGFPFLTQVVKGTYERIDVGIKTWTEQGVTVQDVRIRLDELNGPLEDLVNGDRSRLRAKQATGSAVIPYAVIQAQSTAQGAQGVQKISRSGNNLVAQLTYLVGNRNVDLAVIVSLKPTAQGIVVTPQSVNAGLVTIPIAVLQKDLTYTIPIVGLPMGAKITSVTPEDGGVRVTSSASDVPLNEPLTVR